MVNLLAACVGQDYLCCFKTWEKPKKCMHTGTLSDLLVLMPLHSVEEEGIGESGKGSHLVANKDLVFFFLHLLTGEGL